jgi:orotate phosphoribosyltransferase
VPREVIREPSVAEFFELVSARRGHFRMESGLHSTMWLDLDGLFAEPARVQPFVDHLVSRVRRHRPTVVCGPLVGGALLSYHVARALGVTFSFTKRADVQAGAGLYGARYQLPSAFKDRVRGQRVLLVDDVMSAGSSLRATHAAVVEAGATTVAVGALLVLGDVGRRHFAEQGMSVEASVTSSFDAWPPESCPLCSSGMPIEDLV